MNELATFRAQKDQFFAAHPQSPLTPEQRQTFQGLRYFPEEPTMRLEVSVEEFPEKAEVALPTSTGEVGTYVRYGCLTFIVDGTEVELTLYANHQGFFLPFADASPEQRPIAPGTTSIRSRSAMAGSSLTSTWRTTRIVPTTSSGPARSPPRKSASCADPRRGKALSP